MTGNNKRLHLSAILATISPTSLHVEMKKTSKGAVAVVSGVVSIGEYTDSAVEVVSHSGRLFFFGESLGISVLEGRVLEIYGRITEVRFGYGKS